jgi:hypothetical protein
MNIEEAISAANAWVAHARPIIQAYLAMEDARLSAAICEVHYGEDTISKQRTHDYREADGYVKDAQRSLYDMLDGIRDNYRCDYARSVSMDADEAELDAADAFNDELDRGIVSVDAAVRMVEVG